MRGEEAAVVALRFVRLLEMALHFCGSLGCFHQHSWLQSSALPPLQPVSAQPAAGLFPGLFFKPHFRACSPCLSQRAQASGWGV